MGVRGLWRLLLPIGRRISIETLEGRTLAIDASIWLTQFLKVNRDPDTGAVRPAAHLIGFLRRICKLLYHGVRPVFVFDGATPEIKLREIRARRERRERMAIGVGAGDGGDDGAVKRMARKLLVAELKKRKELEAAQKSGSRKDARASSSRGDIADDSNQSFSTGAFSAGFNLGEEEEEEDTATTENGLKANEAKTAGSEQIQGESNVGGKESATGTQAADAIDLTADNADVHGMHTSCAPNDWDNAGLPGDERSDADGSDGGSEGSSSIQIPQHEEDIDLEAVLSLPASDRKDVIEKAKRQQRMRSRQEFMPVAADPEAYSQVQLRNFLRTSNLNKKIVEVGTKAAKTGEEDGIEGERIASDATRRFIFEKDKDKEAEKGGAIRENETSLPSRDADPSQRLDGLRERGSPERHRHRLRRRSGPADAHHSRRSEDSDDEHIFDADEDGDATESKAPKSRAIYSSSDDEGAGGFLVGDSKEEPSSGRSPDPKRANYASHIRHDAEGWTLDEGNVFAPNENTNGNSNASDDSSDDEGGGFLAADASAGRKREGSPQDGGQQSAQILEDEMLARAIQETEVNESSHTSNGPTSDGGHIASSRWSLYNNDEGLKKGRLRAPGNPPSDEALAAELQAEEDGHYQGATSASLGLLNTVDLTTSDGEGEGTVSNLGSPFVAKAASTPLVQNRGNQETTTASIGKERGHEALASKAASDSDESDDVDWEDGDEATADVDRSEKSERKMHSNAAKGGGNVGRALDLSESIDHGVGDDDVDENIDWEDGDMGEVSEGAPPSTPRSMPKQNRLSDSESKLRPSSDSTMLRNDTFPSDGSRQGEKSEEVKIDADNDDANIDMVEQVSERGSLSETYDEGDGNSANDFDAPVRDANAAALQQAQATAANLTNWAGRAVRRAIAAHMEDTGVNNDVSVAPEAVGGKGADEGSMHGDADINEHAYKSMDAPKSDSKMAVSSQSTSQPTTIQSTAPPPPLMDTSLEALRKEDNQMQEELNRQQRDMDTVSDEMKEEIVDLLRLFGIPYLEAPAEAESQCCALEELGLVDGIVTEDSDAFVFGGKNVYKNIFDDQKYVEVYLAKDAERDLALGRNQMVALAMLLGGDYTDGVKGVGIVNGMEILQAFDVSDDVKAGLTAFRQWLDGFEDPSDDPKSDMKPAEKEFHNKHRSARTRWVAPPGFPSANVLNAYQKPVVDQSEAQFSWGSPDIDNLRTFCYRKMGWDYEETNRAVLPVLKAIESRSNSRQTRLESYFMSYEDDIRFANVKSKRLQHVLGEIKGKSTKDWTGEDNGSAEGKEEEQQEEGGVGAASSEKMEKKSPKRKARSTNKKRKKQKSP